MLLKHPPPKSQWKLITKKAVHNHWRQILIEEAVQKSSLVFLNADSCTLTKSHPTWDDLNCSLSIRKATVKTLLLVGRYPLTTSATAGTRRCDLCPLCNEEPECTTHFILTCKSLGRFRTPYLKHILNTCRSNRLPIDLQTLTRTILDSNNLVTFDLKHETNCRNMLFKLHHERSKMLGGASQYKSVKF